MAFGTFGSTLNDELNRLANGGTYRDMDDMVDEALAAKQWANRENIIPYSTDTVGILNEIAALGPNRQNWYDFNGVCNYLAGTTGLPAAAALRQITTTGDILTSLASYYVDAATPRYNYPGYIYLPGIAGQYLSTPDATALDITGDIDIRGYMASDAWTGRAANGTVLAKYTTSGNQRSYILTLMFDGTLRLIWTTDGINNIIKSSTAAVGFANGSAGWIRATLDVNNGASGNDVKFYTSTNGTTWTQLGSTVTTAGVTSIYSGTSQVEIGSYDVGTGDINLPGKLYQIQVFASLDGTDKRLDVDLTTNVTSATYDQFTATTGQLMTIVGQNTLTNVGTAGSLLPTTVGSSLAADSNDAKFLDFTGTNYVYLPGVASNYLSVPDAAALDITGDIDLRAYVALDDWTPASTTCLVGKWQGGSDRSYTLRVATDGTLSLAWSENGTTALTAFSTVATGLADGSAKWVRVTLDVDNGASAKEVKFFLSDNGTSWTQLGITVGTAGTTSIFNSTIPVSIGNEAGVNMLAGKVYDAQIFASINDTDKRLDVDTSVITAGSATSFTAVTGQTVTINRSTSGRKSVAVTQPTWLFGTDDYMEVNNRYMAHSTAAENYVYLSGVTGNNMLVSDNPPLDITSDIDIQVKVALDDWTPAAFQTLIAKYNTTGNQRTYRLDVSTTGTLALVWSVDGVTPLTANSTVATGIADGAVKWIRATLDVDNGAGGNDVKFYLSDNGTTWTQLGTTVTTAGVTSIYSSTQPQEIGAYNFGQANPARGKFFRSIIKNGIDGTTVLDADASVITLPSQTTFVDRSSNAYTVTINKSGVGTFVSTGNYLYLPGIATNYASAPDSAALDITGNIDLRVKAALDDWTPSATQVLIGKRASGQYSYQLSVLSTGIISMAWTTDGSTTVTALSTVAPTIADGETIWIRATLSVASNYTVIFYTSTDGNTWTQLGTTVTGVGATSIFSGTSPIEVGSVNGGTSTARGKFFRAQVLNGIGGTLVFDANFESSITSLLQTSFTESSTNGATVTINRSGSTFRSAGVIDAGYLYPGATNTFANSTTDFLNFGATDSFTVLTVNRLWTTPTSFGTLIGKRTADANWGYVIRTNGTAVNPQSYVVSSGTLVSNTVATTVTAGTLQQIGTIINRGTNTIATFQNGTTATGTSISTVGSVSNVATLQIGALNVGANSPQDFEFIAAAVFRTVLTATQIRQIVNYFANREVYL